MISKLKRNLCLLLTGSLMLVFSIVFCLLIRQNLKAKERISEAYFNRMVSILIFSMEQETDYRTCLAPYEEKLDYSFQLISDTSPLLYESESILVGSEVFDAFINTFRRHERYFYALEPDEINKPPYSSQSAIYTIRMPDGKKYDCIYCNIVTSHGVTYGLSIVKEADGFLALLMPELKLYSCIWCGVFLFIIFLSRILAKITVRPTEAAMQGQKDFIAAVSHECKAPLAAILSSAEMIDTIPNTSDAVKDHTRVIDQEVSRMSRLIQDLLLLSSLDAGNWSFHIEEINVDTLLINLYTKFEPICNGKEITLQLNIADESYPPLFSDTDRLDQIISVFLDNAVSYSPSSSEITLGASVEKNDLVITIIDHGAGISEKDRPYIFDRFYQCDKSRTQKEHFGLGLSIAHELTDKLGGKIRLFDTDGGGCTFKIYLPFS